MVGSEQLLMYRPSVRQVFELKWTRARVHAALECCMRGEYCTHACVIEVYYNGIPTYVMEVVCSLTARKWSMIFLRTQKLPRIWLHMVCLYPHKYIEVRQTIIICCACIVYLYFYSIYKICLTSPVSFRRTERYKIFIEARTTIQNVKNIRCN